MPLRRPCRSQALLGLSLDLSRARQENRCGLSLPLGGAHRQTCSVVQFAQSRSGTVYSRRPSGEQPLALSEGRFRMIGRVALSMASVACALSVAAPALASEVS